MRLITAVLALAIGLVGCEAPTAVPSPRSAPLRTVEIVGGEQVGCILMFWIADVAADPTFGTVDGTSGEPLLWPSGYTARWAGTEVEVYDRTGNKVLTTGQRYQFSPVYAGGYPNGPIAVCSAKPCTEAESPDDGSFIQCKVGESGPL